MNYRFRTRSDHVVISFAGDVMGGPDYLPFRDQVQRIVDEGHRRIVVDLSRARWLNSTGLGILVSVFRTVHEAGGRMAVCGANQRIRGIYFVAQLDKVLESYPSLDEGVAAVTAA